jgi:hypothetical protein
MTGDTSSIVLYRSKHSGVDRYSPAELWIDNIPRGNVLPYKTIESVVEVGSHRVPVKAEDAISKEMVFEVGPDERLRLTMSSRAGFGLFNALGFGKGVRFLLRRTDPSEANEHPG